MRNIIRIIISNRFTLIVVIIFLNTSPAWSDSIHVPGDFSTIQAAINSGSIGDTVVVGPGVYYEAIRMKEGISLLGSGITQSSIISPDGNLTTLRTASNAFVEGFTIAKEFTGIGATVLCEENSPTIRNNFIVRYGTASEGGIGIWLSYCSAKVEKNFILNFDSGISYLFNSPVIKNNIVKSGSGIGGDSDNATIVNNTIITTKQFGTWLHGKGTVKNNIVMSTVTTEAWGMSVSSGYDRGYNNIWNYNYITLNGAGEISDDPLFVDLLNDVYLLSENSPSIDTGDPEAQYNDLDGTRNDMGAFGGPDPISSTITDGIDKSVEISIHSGFPGDTIVVSVSMNNPIGFQKGIFQINYDKNILAASNIELTSTTEGFSLVADIDTEGIIFAELEGSAEVTGGSGDLLNIEFIVSDSIRSGDASPINFITATLFGGSGIEIELRNVTGGHFVVNQGSEEGNYIYVDDKNIQSEDGSRVSPFNSIQEAIEIATAGDTIVVVGGDYTGPLIMKEGVFLRGAGAQVTYIWGVEFEATVTFNSIEVGEISGFTIDGPINIPEFAPIMSVISSSPKITNNRFEKTLVDLLPAIEVLSNSNPIIEHNAIINSGINIVNSSAVISHNYIEGFETGSAALGLFSSSDVFVDNNEIIAGQGERPGLHIENVTNSTVINNKILCGKNGGNCIFVGDATNLAIYNNLIEDINANANGIVIRNSTEIKLVNNVIIAGSTGIDEDLSDIIAYNNIIMGAANFGITASASSVIDYNDVWNNGVNYNTISKGDHDISADPMFVDAEKHDYRLGEGSPGINAGHSDAVYNDVDGSRNDMGIYGGSYSDSIGLFKLAPALHMERIYANPGDTVEIRLTGINVENIKNILGRISFKSEILSYLFMEKTNLTETFSLATKTVSSDIIGFSIRGTSGLSESEGTLLTFNFVVNKNTTKDFAVIKFEFASVLDDQSISRSILALKNGDVRINPVAVKDDLLIPLEYELSQNYPNPFNPMTTINYSVPTSGNVSLLVYNLRGQVVARLVDSETKSGRHTANWNGSNFASGIYFYRLQAGDFVQTRKMVLLK